MPDLETASSFQTSLPELHLQPGLYLVATPIGNLADITLRALAVLQGCDVIACEDTRHSQKLLQHYGIHKKTISYHEHNEQARAGDIVARIQSGARIALISDAGLPLLNDPGYRVVQAALAAEIYITSIPGANAALTALQLSGLPPHPFLFVGFLPPKTHGRQKLFERYKDFEGTLIAYESPHRLAASLQDALAVLGDRRAAIARELTKLHEETRRGLLSELKTYYVSKEVKGEIVLLIKSHD